VIFPTGREAVHHRVLSNSDPSGSAALPVIEGRILLIRHFRHAPRQWSWEIPRGAIEPGQSALAAAKSELEEEIDAKVEHLIPLGRVHGAGALISGSVALFVAQVSAYGAPSRNEGISEIRVFETATVERMIEASEITDSFTLAAFLHARLRALL